MADVKFEKKAVFEHLADSIEAQVRQEGWKGLLPSGRDLAQMHQVSLPTVQKAIALLLERKVVVARGGKRRHEIAAGVARPSIGAEQPEVLVLSTKPLAAYDTSISMGVHLLGAELQSAGAGYRFVDLSAFQGPERRKAARAEMVKTKPTHCIMMAPDKSVHAGVARYPARFASMFSPIRSKRVEQLGIRYGYLVEIAIRQLVALGHRRYFMPFLGRKKKLQSSMQAIVQVAKAHGVNIKVRQSPEACSPANMAKALEAGLRDGVTAVIFPQWTDFMPAIGYFARRGLEFPRDLSVVALIGNSTSALYVPPIAGCLSAPESIAQQTALWIRSAKVDDAAYQSVYARTWTSGNSIGPAPARGLG